MSEIAWLEVPLIDGERPRLAHTHCVIAEPGLHVGTDLLAVAAMAFDAGWEAAIPIYSWHGSDPVVWDRRLVIVRRSRAAFELMKRWRGGSSAALATAIYESGAKVLPLAPVEGQGDADTGCGSCGGRNTRAGRSGGARDVGAVGLGDK